MDQIVKQSLVNRRQLQQIIAGLSEGVILIDPDHAISWANEAALAMHGAEDLAGLGENAEDYRRRFALQYRNNHPLAKGAYPIDRVIAGELFEDVVVEVRPRVDAETGWVHRVRSLVLTDAAGEPDCFVLVVTDASDQFQAEDRFQKAFNANPAPALICRIDDLRYIRVNQGFMDMTGYARDDVVGRSVYEIDVFEGSDKRALCKQRLADWATVPQSEAILRLPDDETKLVIVAGQPIEIGDEKCMLITFSDLEPRRKAESALRHSEERFAKTFRLAPVPMKICSLDGFRILDVNEAFLRATGYGSVDVVGRSTSEIELWEQPDLRRVLERQLVETGSFMNYEAKLRTKDGALIDCLVSAEAVTIQGEACVLDCFQDISERKHSELELLSAIEAAMKDTTFSRGVVEKLANLRSPQSANKGHASLSDLTPREQEVLGLMCLGTADEEISSTLGMSRNTVRNHVARIYGKIDVHRRSDAIVWARERGFVGPEKSPAKTPPASFAG